MMFVTTHKQTDKPLQRKIKIKKLKKILKKMEKKKRKLCPDWRHLACVSLCNGSLHSMLSRPVHPYSQQSSRGDSLFLTLLPASRRALSFKNSLLCTVGLRLFLKGNSPREVHVKFGGRDLRLLSLINGQEGLNFCCPL